ncbi:hypothetical protein IEO21_05020 [Rhodonia placenta]|uniref:Uncharacterized protein n=1 Tax=Rhodonia placenta TaxID=104341 RepID=A0A8H7P2M0_9APHY|nr:hypothetical protein IEO21_05020 [Postia placenta]
MCTRKSSMLSRMGGHFVLLSTGKLAGERLSWYTQYAISYVRKAELCWLPPPQDLQLNSIQEVRRRIQHSR